MATNKIIVIKLEINPFVFLNTAGLYHTIIERNKKWQE